MIKPKKDRNLNFIDGKWYVDFTFNKKRVRAFGGRTKEQARIRLAQLRIVKVDEKLGLKKPEKKLDILFEKFADEFIELYSKQHKRSWKRDEVSLKSLKPFFKGKMLRDIGPQLVENYKAKRKADKTPRKTLVKEATINREIALLKTMFNTALKWGKIEKNLIDGDAVKKFKENQKAMRILSDKEMIKLIDAAPSHISPIIIIAANTGMRKMEILSLKWEDIDFRRGIIHIKDSKSGRAREVYMNCPVFEALKVLPQESEFVFFNQATGNHVTSVRKSFKKACEDMGIKNFRFHDLRHCCATKMVEAGVDLVTVSKILGHSDIKLTMRYAHPGEKTMRAAAEKLGQIYEQTRQKVDSPTEEVKIKGTATHLISGH